MAPAIELSVGLVVAGLGIAVPWVAPGTKSIRVRFVGHDDSLLRGAGSHAGDAGLGADVEALEVVAVIRIEDELRKKRVGVELQ